MIRISNFGWLPITILCVYLGKVALNVARIAKEQAVEQMNFIGSVWLFIGVIVLTIILEFVYLHIEKGY